MKKIHISPHYNSPVYEILITSHILDKISDYIDIEGHSRIFICMDEKVESLFGARMVDALRSKISRDYISVFSFPSGEDHKTLETVAKMYRALTDYHVDRHSLIINFGGGVVSDLGSFAAATYMRGVPFITVPTTLESMVDACMGGKTGVNFHGLKNYIGTITQPQKVVIDVAFLSSLPQRVLIQGYAEVLKHGLIADRNYFMKSVKKPLVELDENELISIITRSLEIKASIIEKDPEEKNERKLLNFGHTIGHVVESLSLKTDKPFYHGEAVAIGLIGESYLSYMSGYLSEKDLAYIEKSVADAGLPTRCAMQFSQDDMFSLLHTDKKNQSGVVKWTLLSEIGLACIDQVIDEVVIRKALQYIQP